MRRVSLLLTAATMTLALLGLTSCSSSDESATTDDTTAADATVDADGNDGDSADSSDSSGEETPTNDDTPSAAADGQLVERIVASMMTDSDSPFTEDQARCYAKENVRIIGADRIEKSLDNAADVPTDDEGLLDLNEFDFSEIDLTKPEAYEIYDAAKGCGLDLRAVMLESMVENGMPESARSCVEDVVTEDTVRELMVSVMTDGPAAFMVGAGAQFGQALMACDPEASGD